MTFIPKESVAIILVNWNGYELTVACLHSLRKVDYPDFKILVVDNGSEKNEGAKLKQTFSEIQLIQSADNLGFTGGNNLGIREALNQGFSHILLLNNDTEVEPDFLGEMMRKFTQVPGTGVVQPMILFLEDKKRIWSAGGKWVPILGRAITIGDRDPLSNYRLKSPKIDWATGCCMLVSREAILKVGLLNEQYFAYFEDVDWSLRFADAGFGLTFADRAIVYHEAGGSSKSKNKEGTLSPRVFYFHVRNQLLLLRFRKRYLGFAYHLPRFVAWMGYFLVRTRWKKLASVARGIRAGLFEPLQSPILWP